MRHIYNILVYSVLSLIIASCGGSGGGGGGGGGDNTALDNAPHIIEFTQPSVYADGSSMSVPSSVAGYYLYICHIIDGQMIDNMVWVAEIRTNTNPLTYDNNAWRGKWDILNILKTSPELIGTKPDDTHAFSLRAISTILIDGKEDLSSFSTPWSYGNNPHQLDNTQIPREGSLLEKHPSNPIDMLFNTGSGSK